MKKRFILLLPLTWLVFIGLFYIDKMLTAVPLPVSIAVSLLVVIADLLIIIRIRSGKGLKIPFSILSVLAVAIYNVFGIACNPYWHSNTGYSNRPLPDSYADVLTSQQAIEDLDYMMTFLKKDHPACYGGVPSEVLERYNNVKSELESLDTITVNELCRKTEYVLSCLHDGHTYTFPQYDYHYLKDSYSDELAGYKTVSVNGLTIDELAKQSADLISYEAESWEITRIRSLYFTLEGLDYLGLDNTEVTYVFEKDGQTITRTYTQEDYALIDEIEIKSDNSALQSFVSYKIDEEKSLAIMTLTSCRANSEYNKAVKDMFTEVKEKNIRHVAVDPVGDEGHPVTVEDIHRIDVIFVFSASTGNYLAVTQDTKGTVYGGLVELGILDDVFDVEVEHIPIRTQLIDDVFKHLHDGWFEVCKGLKPKLVHLGECFCVNCLCPHEDSLA